MLRKQFYKLAKEYHPDLSTKKDCESIFREVKDAYEFLCVHNENCSKHGINKKIKNNKKDSFE